MLPNWPHNGGPDRLKDVLRSLSERQRLRHEIVPRWRSWHDIWLTYFKCPQNKQYERHSVADVAEMRGQPVVDVMYDLLLEKDLRISYVAAGINAATLPKFIAHPHSMVCRDALLLGDYPAPTTTLTNPKQYPVGINYVIVNGQLVNDDGQHTGALTGVPSAATQPAHNRLFRPSDADGDHGGVSATGRDP